MAISITAYGADKRGCIVTKYGAKPQIIDGIRFASKAEARRYGQLKLLEAAGEVCSLEIQPKFKFEINGEPLVIRSERYPNGRQAVYRADFAYFCNRRGRRIVEDVKGGRATRTEAYKLRRALVESLFGVTVEEIAA